MADIRVHRVPFSTNVERVALACGIKGVEVEWIDHDQDDRSAIVELSGQPLAPVAEFGDLVVSDSPRILEHLDRVAPEPRLFPRLPAERAHAEIFVEWFNEVWKGPPNALDEAYPNAHPAEAALVARISGWTDRFEEILRGSDFLLGDEIGIADVVAYPFLRYAIDEPDRADEQPFHRILHERLRGGDHVRLDRWIARIAALPQA